MASISVWPGSTPDSVRLSAFTMSMNRMSEMSFTG
jgi:hypothetical protein